MIVIGIVGGIASGKSWVAKTLEKFGGFRIDADQIGHQVLQQQVTLQRIKDTWGDRVIGSDGNVDRSSLGSIVFKNQTDLEKLENITHPEIEFRIQQILRDLPDSIPAVIIDAPVLLKAGWDRHCDKILFVECDYETRLKRCQLRGWTKEMLDQREAAQVPLESKRRRSTDRVANHPSESKIVHAALRKLWREWGLTFNSETEQSEA